MGISDEMGAGVLEATPLLLLKEGVDAKFLLVTSLAGPGKKYKSEHNKIGDYKHNTI